MSPNFCIARGGVCDVKQRAPGDTHVRNVRVFCIARGGVCDVKQRAPGDTHVRNVRVFLYCPWWGV